MSKPELPAKNTLICRECGISNRADARECWLCHGTRWKPQGQGRDRGVHSRGFFSTIAGWMVLIAGLGLALAVYKGSPGDQIVAIVLVVPPWLMVEARAAKLRRAGRSDVCTRSCRDVPDLFDLDTYSFYHGATIMSTALRDLSACLIHGSFQAKTIAR